MIKVERSEVKNGAIVFPEPLGLAEGTRVAVTIEPLPDAEAVAPPAGGGEFASLPFFGIWADRAEMEDSARWVRQEREQWQQRTLRPD